MPDIFTLKTRFEEAYRQGQYSKAAELCAELAELYDQDGDALSAAEMKNNRSVALLRAGKANEAYEAAQGTDLIFVKAGDLRRQALALGNQAAALESLGKGDQAIVLYGQSAELLEKIGDKEFHSSVMKTLAVLYAKKGKGMDSAIAMQASLAGDKPLSLREKVLKFLFKRLLNIRP